MSGDPVLEKAISELDIEKLNKIISENNEIGSAEIIYLTKFRRSIFSHPPWEEDYEAEGLIRLYRSLDGNSKKRKGKGPEIGTFPVKITAVSKAWIDGERKRTINVEIQQVKIKYEIELEKLFND